MTAMNPTFASIHPDLAASGAAVSLQKTSLTKTVKTI
jgi:hypothetical protein